MIQAPETSSFSFRRSIANYMPRSNTSRTEDIGRLTVSALLEVLQPITPFLPIQLPCHLPAMQFNSRAYSDTPIEMKILDLDRVIWLASSRGSKRLEADTEKLSQFCADYTVIYCKVNSFTAVRTWEQCSRW